KVGLLNRHVEFRRVEGYRVKAGGVMRGGIVRQFVSRRIALRGIGGIDAQGVDRQCIEVRTLEQFGVDGQFLRRLIARYSRRNLLCSGFSGLDTHDRRNGRGLFHGLGYLRRVGFPRRLPYDWRRDVPGVGMIITHDGRRWRFLESLQGSPAPVGKSRDRKRQCEPYWAEKAPTAYSR